MGNDLHQFQDASYLLGKWVEREKDTAIAESVNFSFYLKGFNPNGAKI